MNNIELDLLNDGILVKIIDDYFDDLDNRNKRFNLSDLLLKSVQFNELKNESINDHDFLETAPMFKEMNFISKDNRYKITITPN